MEMLKLPDLDLAYHLAGDGPPLIFLHGWPEWSAIWRKNTPVLARDFTVIAPDLRNFGDSRGAEARDVSHYVTDIEALADHLGLTRFGLVRHDVGGFLAQEYARRNPQRPAGLFFFDCPHFGIGPRWVQGQQVREIWYQSFHQLPLAQELVGASRESCRAYFRHFLSHWAGSPDAFDEPALEEWVDNFLKPGNLAGGFRWYAYLGGEARAVAHNIFLDGNTSGGGPSVDRRPFVGEAQAGIAAQWGNLRGRLGQVLRTREFEEQSGSQHFGSLAVQYQIDF